jgi:uncharacterized phage-associated protein
MSNEISPKMVNTILFFLHEANNRKLGKVKLAKLLFFADLKAYKATNEPITGIDYLRMNLGPMPQGFDKVLDSMQRAKLIRKGRRNQTPFLPAKPYDLSVFSETEQKVLRSVAKEFLSCSTEMIIYLSHQNYAWIHLLPRSYVSLELASLDSEEEVKELIAIANKLTATEIIEGSPELLASLKRGIEDARRGKLYPVDSLFE